MMAEARANAHAILTDARRQAEQSEYRWLTELLENEKAGETPHEET